MTAPTMHALFDGSDLGLIPDLAERLDDVLGLADKATPGEWEFRDEDGSQEVGVAGDAYSSICDNETYYPQAVGIEDMRLIAAAVSLLRDHGPALRALLAEHEALLRRVAGVAAKWDQIAEEHGVRQFTGNDHRLFANELRVAMGILAEPGEVG